ncbi:lipid A 1-phosphatase [Candidatus Hepatincolaceae symbiont of Richtersius coronifer]
MPSGHSAAASSAAAFIILRYGWGSVYLASMNFSLIIITFLTMYARIALKQHTFSAVIAGSAIGIIMAIIVTSKYKKFLGKNKP